MGRDYAPIIRALRGRLRPGMSRGERMQLVADLLWDAFGSAEGRVSWVGFYLPDDAGRALVLGPRRDKPACSPISLDGVCGRAFTSARPVIADDVRTLGGSYIACDPRDRSELVVPMTDDAGQCLGVIDLDSHTVGAFDADDAAGAAQTLITAGLTSERQQRHE